MDENTPLKIFYEFILLPLFFHYTLNDTPEVAKAEFKLGTRKDLVERVSVYAKMKNTQEWQVPEREGTREIT